MTATTALQVVPSKTGETKPRYINESDFFNQKQVEHCRLAGLPGRIFREFSDVRSRTRRSVC